MTRDWDHPRPTPATKLKPCAHCGDNSDLVQDDLGWLVACCNRKCGSTVGTFPTSGMALRAWNIRSLAGAAESTTDEATSSSFERQAPRLVLRKLAAMCCAVKDFYKDSPQ